MLGRVPPAAGPRGDDAPESPGPPSFPPNVNSFVVSDDDSNNNNRY
jgi:hypothetical protein